MTSLAACTDWAGRRGKPRQTDGSATCAWRHQTGQDSSRDAGHAGHKRGVKDTRAPELQALVYDILPWRKVPESDTRSVRAPVTYPRDFTDRACLLPSPGTHQAVQWRHHAEGQSVPRSDVTLVQRHRRAGCLGECSTRHWPLCHPEFGVECGVCKNSVQDEVARNKSRRQAGGKREKGSRWAGLAVPPSSVLPRVATPVQLSPAAISAGWTPITRSEPARWHSTVLNPWTYNTSL